MKSSINNLFLILSLISLFSCGGGKSGSGVSSLNSSLTSPYKYFVYVANTSDNTISSFSMNRANGLLTPIETTASEGNPVSLAVSPSGDKLYVAKSSSANLQVFSINKTNGALVPFQSISANSSSQSSVAVSADGRFVYLTSWSGVGNTYSVSALTGNLFPVKSIDVTSSKVYIHPNGNLMFLMSGTGITFWPINQSTGEALISGGAYTASMSQPQTMALSPDGRMYASFNNGYGLINSYNLDLTNRTASSIQMASIGNSAGGIAISNFGKVLIATEPNNNKLHSYLINSSTGALTEVDSKPTENNPQQALFFPDGQYALVVNRASKSVSTFLVDENSGTLKSVGSASVGTDSNALVIVKTSN